MKKNKKSVILSLKVLSGLLISMALILLAYNVVYSFSRLHDSSRDSFYELIRMIEDANKNNDEAELESMTLRMDKDTIILGFSKGEKLAHITKPLEYGCEEDKVCICLLRNFDKTKLFAGEISGKVICEVLEDLEFTNLQPEESLFHEVSGGICISRSESLRLGIRTTEDPTLNRRQFRTVYAHKYKGNVTVCEFLNKEENSCIPVEYLNEDKAFEGMKKLAEFIESCKESEIKEEGSDYCGCGLFNFEYYMPEDYGVKFSKDKDNELNLILRKNKKDIEKKLKLSDINFYGYVLGVEESRFIDYLDEVIIDNVLSEIDSKYAFCRGEEEDGFCDESYSKNQITFVKSKDNNVCIVWHHENDLGRVGLKIDESNQEPNSIEVRYVGDITLKSIIQGCSYE